MRFRLLLFAFGAVYLLAPAAEASDPYSGLKSGLSTSRSLSSYSTLGHSYSSSSYHSYRSPMPRSPYRPPAHISAPWNHHYNHRSNYLDSSRAVQRSHWRSQYDRYRR